MTSASPSRRVDLRKEMPYTANWIDDVRQRLGKAYVDGMIRRALGGERNCFYAVEGGHILGSPFDWSMQGAMLVAMSVLTGEPFLVAIREADGVLIGKADANLQKGHHGAH